MRAAPFCRWTSRSVGFRDVGRVTIYCQPNCAPASEVVARAKVQRRRGHGEAREGDHVSPRVALGKPSTHERDGRRVHARAPACPVPAQPAMFAAWKTDPARCRETSSNGTSSRRCGKRGSSCRASASPASSTRTGPRPARWSSTSISAASPAGASRRLPCTAPRAGLPTERRTSARRRTERHRHPRGGAGGDRAGSRGRSRARCAPQDQGARLACPPTRCGRHRREGARPSVGPSPRVGRREVWWARDGSRGTQAQGTAGRGARHRIDPEPAPCRPRARRQCRRPSPAPRIERATMAHQASRSRPSRALCRVHGRSASSSVGATSTAGSLRCARVRGGNRRLRARDPRG